MHRLAALLFLLVLASPARALEASAGVELGLGYSSNMFHLSDTEARIQATAVSGAQLNGSYPVWPGDNNWNLLLLPALELELRLPAGRVESALRLRYRPSLPARTIDAMSHPIELRYSQGLVAGPGPEPLMWLELTGRLNPWDYDRPLRVVDAQLHNPLPDRFVQAVRLRYGGDLFVGFHPGYGLRLGPCYAIERLEYPKDLDPWDALDHHLGARFGAEAAAGLLDLELRGGYLTRIARGNLKASYLREPDSSSRGAEARLALAVDLGRIRSDLWLRFDLEAGVVHKVFITGDRYDRSHFGRKDVGVDGLFRLFYGLSQGPARGLGFSLAYGPAWNHTNLDTGRILPEDENDFLDHRASFTLHYQRDFAGKAVAEP